MEPVQALCPAGVEFIASHPMAGRETSSVEHAAEVNFAPANFIITPTEKNTPAGIQWAKELAEVCLLYTSPPCWKRPQPAFSSLRCALTIKTMSST